MESMETDYKTLYSSLKRKYNMINEEKDQAQLMLEHAKRQIKKLAKEKSFLLDRLIKFEEVSSDSEGESEIVTPMKQQQQHKSLPALAPSSASPIIEMKDQVVRERERERDRGDRDNRSRNDTGRSSDRVQQSGDGGSSSSRGSDRANDRGSGKDRDMIREKDRQQAKVELKQQQQQQQPSQQREKREKERREVPSSSSDYYAKAAEEERSSSGGKKSNGRLGGQMHANPPEKKDGKSSSAGHDSKDHQLPIDKYSAQALPDLRDRDVNRGAVAPAPIVEKEIEESSPMVAAAVATNGGTPKLEAQDGFCMAFGKDRHCKSKALANCRYCWHHAPLDPNSGYVWCLFVSANKKKCNIPVQKSKGQSFCAYHQNQGGSKPNGSEGGLSATDGSDPDSDVPEKKKKKQKNSDKSDKKDKDRSSKKDKHSTHDKTPSSSEKRDKNRDKDRQSKHESKSSSNGTSPDKPSTRDSGLTHHAMLSEPSSPDVFHLQAQQDAFAKTSLPPILPSLKSLSPSPSFSPKMASPFPSGSSARGEGMPLHKLMLEQDSEVDIEGMSSPGDRAPINEKIAVYDSSPYSDDRMPAMN
ncbi:hypothetical protein SAMD00019534_009880 [Acytostelium subglobosum LB1]|uniref:hypothetical protein n=1 Tax=Acytostelium subglobosum LB1 TaxID=1410327 RepID=UPI000644C7BC|nr:hypothetical protein SAMD00019534_009880 [Acytostelium subglobosum LB1]GAM17813.1 hypothetical protein SAMD00019534_009880 [Acytostelium subglobosum LB1]|eukprot:XP_012758409.1 hypothetical protein SAMD00019534_009880 [Acytostelium subglobosum LB1]